MLLIHYIIHKRISGEPNFYSVFLGESCSSNATYYRHLWSNFSVVDIAYNMFKKMLLIKEVRTKGTLKF